MRDFLVGLEEGQTQYYLTTQDLGVSPDGRPNLMSSPCTELFSNGDFPLVPSIIGNLIPMNYNIWMGSTPSSSTGTSSGLHHDYHDNLYVLLRGRKHFRILPPSAAPSMLTKGEVSAV
eukprot:CAMPEP_0118636812 /NCGR_PEP_ID=MMETSP0785-20121206/2826_1 /TAXON_ID=91992 /ORGANISM="Bolidomonas pacifica, Strain CCMP 1866" /LENGTH=117 /DNA_ID=CAMNT_0006527971 /DNA_START=14 /DNA_END=363 /DNA_ORIENTATION=-